jgi:hypothetical protein
MVLMRTMKATKARAAIASPFATFFSIASTRDLLERHHSTRPVSTLPGQRASAPAPQSEAAGEKQATFRDAVGSSDRQGARKLRTLASWAPGQENAAKNVLSVSSRGGRRREAAAVDQPFYGRERK